MDLTRHSTVKVEFTEFEILFSSHILDSLGLLTPCPFISFSRAPNSQGTMGPAAIQVSVQRASFCTGVEIQTNVTPLFFFPTEISRNQSLIPKLSPGTMKERKIGRRCRTMLSLGVHASGSFGMQSLCTGQILHLPLQHTSWEEPLVGLLKPVSDRSNSRVVLKFGRRHRLGIFLENN